MAVSIHLPKVGMTMEEGTLTKWLLPDGAAVKRGDVIFEMETEKVQMEIEAEADGTLKQLAAEGAVLHPGDVVGALLATGEEVPQDLLDRVTQQSGGVPAMSQTTAAELAATEPSATQPPAGGPARISPVARRLADENGIDVSTITGSGPDGRIVERDVQLAIEGRTSTPAPSLLRQSSGQTPAERGPTEDAAMGARAGRPAEGGMLKASPVARRLADEHGIDLRSISGTGPEGRIVERDVQRAIEARGVPETTRPSIGEGVAPVTGTPYAAGLGTAARAYSGRRRTTGQRMLESLSSMAQLTLVSETALDEALTMLHGLNREWRRDGIVVTLPALVLRACALALREHPTFNARLEGEQIVLAPEINVGLAVNQEHGLMVPVVRNADAATLKDVAQTVNGLVQKSKADSLTLDDVSGGTFTVTSLDGTVVDAFTPIINPPQAAILGVGRVRDVAAFDGANVVKRQVTTLSLTFDHRLNDGAPAAAFLERIEELLSRPYVLM